LFPKAKSGGKVSKKNSLFSDKIPLCLPKAGSKEHKGKYYIHRQINFIKMRRVYFIIIFLFSGSIANIFSQSSNDTVAYLLTCAPGTETYSIYGHSALRIVIPDKKTDAVYNWGVFDFSTPNFAWKFAKGRLDYMLIEEPLKDRKSVV
jgi:hypothetical protein